MVDSKNLARYIQSLATVLQESAEIGQMSSAVYADLFELLSELAGSLQKTMAADSYTVRTENI